MYDKLAEALRLCVKYGKAADALANAQKAADAIEELQKVGNALLAKYEQAATDAILEYSGDIYGSLDWLYAEVGKYRTLLKGPGAAE